MALAANTGAPKALALIVSAVMTDAATTAGLMAHPARTVEVTELAANVTESMEQAENLQADNTDAASAAFSIALAANLQAESVDALTAAAWIELAAN